jgi:hypothetical protein
MLPATKHIAHGLLRRVFLVNTIRFIVQPMAPRVNKIGPPISNRYVSAEYNIDDDMMKKNNNREKYFEISSILYYVETTFMIKFLWVG